MERLAAKVFTSAHRKEELDVGDLLEEKSLSEKIYVTLEELVENKDRQLGMRKEDEVTQQSERRKEDNYWKKRIRSRASVFKNEKKKHKEILSRITLPM